MIEETFQPCQNLQPSEAFSDVHYDLQGVYDSCAYHHQTQLANETWNSKANTYHSSHNTNDLLCGWSLGAARVVKA